MRSKGGGGDEGEGTRRNVLIIWGKYVLSFEYTLELWIDISRPIKKEVNERKAYRT